MLAEVTNKARSARGFQLADGSTHLVEPGVSARLDLADHRLHGVWEAAGEVAIRPMVPAEDPPASGEAPTHSPTRGPHPEPVEGRGRRNDRRPRLPPS